MNLASLVLRHARSAPERLALAIPTRWDDAAVLETQRVTYGELGSRISAVRRGVAAAGLGPGDRVVLMFPVCVELYVLAMALLASGLVVVLVDTGMGTRRVTQAIRDARARAIVSVDGLLRYRWVLPALWGLRRFTLDGAGGLGVAPWAALEPPGDGPPDAAGIDVVPRAADDHGLITFTSGSTGRPKGADRTHGLLIAQHEALRAHFPDDRDDVDMPCFPVVTLHNLCCGIPTVMPAVDLSAPAAVKPGPVLAQAHDEGVTRISGAPAYIRRLADALVTRGMHLPRVRHVLVGGAPVPRDLCARVVTAFPAADCDIVYGSTEAEPIASVAMRDVLTASGPEEGYLVGAPVEQAEVALVDLPEPPPRLDSRGVEPWRVSPGAAGEVVVAGDHVNRGYVDNPEADRENKLFGPGGAVWHRTGDLAHLDATGRLWLTGRTSDVLHLDGRVVHPLPVEAALDAIPGVSRCALVTHPGALGGEVAVALEPGASRAAATARVREALDARELAGVAVRVVARVPVDRRHNSKLDRPALRRELSRR